MKSGNGVSDRKRQMPMDEVMDVIKDKDKDGILPCSEYMEFACRDCGVHQTYMYILTHKVNLCMQSLKYHETLK